MKILGIDSSGTVASVALVDDDGYFSFVDVWQGSIHPF